MGVHIQMIKNIVILALFVVNGTLVYAFVVRNPPPPPQPFTPQIVPVNQDMAQEATLHLSNSLPHGKTMAPSLSNFEKEVSQRI